MKALKVLRNAACAAGALLTLAAAPADALTYDFIGTFTDGQAAIGEFTLNVYGFPATPTSITTDDGLFAGATYAIPGSPTATPASNVLVLSSPSYNRYLYLAFANPLSDGIFDTLIAASSFECDGYGSTSYACTGGPEKIRYFASGSATPVPEPETILTFGAALMAIGMGVRAKRKKSASA